MKKLVCDRCGKYLGEIEKGRIAKDAICLCGECNYNILLKDNKTKPPPNINENDSIDFLKGVFNMK